MSFYLCPLIKGGIAQPLGREGVRHPEGSREEDKSLLDRAKDGILARKKGEPRSREGTDRPDRR
jgi:hypothetical protein